MPKPTDHITLYKTHSLRWLAQIVCQIIKRVGWESEFSCEGVSTVAEFSSLVNQLEALEPVSCAVHADKRGRPGAIPAQSGSVGGNGRCSSGDVGSKRGSRNQHRIQPDYSLAVQVVSLNPTALRKFSLGDSTSTTTSGFNKNNGKRLGTTTKSLIAITGTCARQIQTAPAHGVGSWRSHGEADSAGHSILRVSPQTERAGRPSRLYESNHQISLKIRFVFHANLPEESLD